jgi:hypothetical protein
MEIFIDKLFEEVKHLSFNELILSEKWIQFPDAFKISFIEKYYYKYLNSIYELISYKIKLCEIPYEKNENDKIAELIIEQIAFIISEFHYNAIDAKAAILTMIKSQVINDSFSRNSNYNKDLVLKYIHLQIDNLEHQKSIDFIDESEYEIADRDTYRKEYTKAEDCKLYMDNFKKENRDKIEEFFICFIIFYLELPDFRKSSPKKLHNHSIITIQKSFLDYHSLFQFSLSEIIRFNDYIVSHRKPIKFTIPTNYC